MGVDLNSLASYDYDLPERLIAQAPCEPRDACRLLVVDRKSRTFSHKTFTDLPDDFDERDLAIANDTKVLPARLLGQRVKGDGSLGGKIEFVLLEEREPAVWEGLFHASASYVPGLRFRVPTPDGQGLNGELVIGSKDMPGGTVVARFDRDPIESGAGQLPLPHYIDRGVEAADASAYQTVYARHNGSAAAPTAGLHFTERVLARLRERQVAWHQITLHVGLGTFRPVKTENVAEHSMHEERYFISPETAAAVTRAKRDSRRIFAVGTTSVRTLESAWDGERLRSGAGRTSIFIRPGGPHPVRVVDRLLTNFHLPKSTLLMLVCAFADRELILAAYEEAVRREYRFFSYGDAMLIL
jgi:S-adenosylmethionine:tRNA ribosyltransferase-isomerase